MGFLVPFFSKFGVGRGWLEAVVVEHLLSVGVGMAAGVVPRVSFLPFLKGVGRVGMCLLLGSVLPRSLFLLRVSYCFNWVSGVCVAACFWIWGSALPDVSVSGGADVRVAGRTTAFPTGGVVPRWLPPPFDPLGFLLRSRGVSLSRAERPVLLSPASAVRVVVGLSPLG